MNATRPRDVLVIGAGPAGSSAALRLAAAGRDVLLLDRHHFPRDKACGDALMPDAVAALRRAGLYDRVRAEARVVGGARAFSPSRAEVLMDAEFLTLKRERLDHLLVEEAVRRGAELRTGRVTALRPDGGAEVVAEVAGAGEPLRARFVVLATGADVSLLRPLGGVLRPEPSGVAIRRYVRSDSRPLDELLFAYDRTIAPGYAWIFPTGAGEYNVGIGIFDRGARRRALDPREVLDRFLREFPLARELVGAASATGPVRGARLRVGLGGVLPVTAGRIVAAGDAIAATFPFTGEGIGKALETGWLAADAVDEALRSGSAAAAAAYAAELERLRPRYAGYETASRWIAIPWLADLVMRRVARSAALRREVRGIIEESVDPRTVFSWRAVVRSFIG